MAIYLIAKYPRARRASDFDNLAEQFLGHQSACRIVRIIYANELGLGCDKATQFVKIRQVIVVLSQLQNLNVSPEGFWNRI